MKKTPGICVSAVVVAAGRGSRMNMDVNKQYIEICGKPVLARTLQVFQDCWLVRDIIVVANENDIIYCRESIIRKFGFDKVRAIVTGGAERQNSVYNGLLEVDKNCEIVLIHDGARPFVDEEQITECVQAACDFGAASLAVPVKDTIKKTDSRGFVQDTLERTDLWAVQTPQAFRLGLILDAHKKAADEEFTGTDDAVLAERAGHRLKLVDGSYYNIKITTREDLLIAEAIASNLD
jgi:2-C-methyl-D-erythritol 4-phosphate cytidylyltransferase